MSLVGHCPIGAIVPMRTCRTLFGNHSLSRGPSDRAVRIDSIRALHYAESLPSVSRPT